MGGGDKLSEKKSTFFVEMEETNVFISIDLLITNLYLFKLLFKEFNYLSYLQFFNCTR